MTTIKDVARNAGVSISTVSYAMNGNPKVSEVTRDRIMKIAKELNYSPSGVARNLKRQKTGMIGLFMEALLGPYFSSLISSIQDSLPQDYDLIIATIDHGEKSSAYNLLRHRWVDGGIIVNSRTISDEMILEIAERLPLVLIDREPGFHLNKGKNPSICTMLLENEKGAYEAVSHLIQLGRKKIAYLSGPDSSFDNRMRYEGYVHALQKAGLKPFLPLISGDFHNKKAYEAVKSWLKAGYRPDAIFAANDEMAMGAMQAISESGLNVPRDIAIVGFDDVDFASRIEPALSTVKYDRYFMGQIAVKAIFDRIQQKEVEDIIRIDTSLVIRKSSGVSLI